MDTLWQGSLVTVGIAAVVSALVTLGLEWVAKPQLEARKERILVEHRALHELVDALGRVIVSVDGLLDMVRLLDLELGWPLTEADWDRATAKARRRIEEARESMGRVIARPKELPPGLGPAVSTVGLAVDQLEALLGQDFSPGWAEEGRVERQLQLQVIGILEEQRPRIDTHIEYLIATGPFRVWRRRKLLRQLQAIADDEQRKWTAGTGR